MFNACTQGSSAAFVPFPQTSLEKTEASYLYLRDKRKEQKQKQKVHENKVQKDFPLFSVISEEDDKNQNTSPHSVTLKEALKVCEEDLLKAYQEEYVEKIRAEQEKVRQSVAEGKHDQNSQRGRKTGQKKSSVSFPQAPKIKTEEEIKAEAEKIAHARLKELRKEKGGFRALLNGAAKILEPEGVPFTVSFNGGSHGTLQIGDQKMTLVRPHGALENKISHHMIREAVGFITEAYSKILMDSIYKA